MVLEARDRVGGRIWTQERESGVTVDRGGGWLAPKHDAAHALAAEMGVTTYKTHVAGKHLLVGGGRTRTYKGLIPKISPLAVATIARAQWKIDRLSKQVPLEAPWTAAKAAEWDATSVGEYLETTGIRTEIARDLFEMAIRGLAHRRPPRRVAAQPADARARPPQPRDALLHRGRLAGEPRWTAAPA